MIINKNLFSLIIYFFFLQSTVIAQVKKHPPITPRWTFEHIVWEDSLNTQNAAERLVDLYKEHNMPVGAIIIDSPWSTAYNNFEWNKERYPNPGEMVQHWNQEDVKTILWMTGCVNRTANDVPLEKDPSFDEVVEKGYAINNGNTSHWWKGDGVHIDFTNPEAVKWWNSQLDKVLKVGIYGFKVDQGEVYFGDTVKTSKGRMSNVDFRPYYYDSMFQYITRRKSGGAILGRPFSHQGGIEASVDQLSVGWCGDFQGSWDGLKLQINNIYKSTKLGYGAPGCEVGGFFKARSSKNELIRYAQFGALTATMINGGMNGAFTNHLPWYHDQETSRIYQQAVWLHSQLIPYLFSTVVDAHKNGGSLLKNVSFEEESHTVGNYLFTKAITSINNTVTFSIPQSGQWMDFWSKNVINGGTKITRTYPLNRFPLFIKKGAIIPMDISNSFSGIGDATLAGRQTIYILPDKQLSTYHYYRPVGDGTDYDSITIAYDGKRNKIQVNGKRRLPYTFIIQTSKRPKYVMNSDEWSYDREKKQFFISKMGKDFKIKLAYSN